jgi:hypothetical protein
MSKYLEICLKRGHWLRGRTSPTDHSHDVTVDVNDSAELSAAVTIKAATLRNSTPSMALIVSCGSAGGQWARPNGRLVRVPLALSWPPVM